MAFGQERRPHVRRYATGDFARDHRVLFRPCLGLCHRRTVRERLSAVLEAFPELPATRNGADAGTLCGNPAAHVLCAVHHHATPCAVAASKAAAPRSSWWPP